MRLSKLLAMVAIVVAFASCGTLRKNKNKQSQSIETVSKKDSLEVSTATSSGEVKEQVIDKGIVVTQRETTTVTEKGGKSKVILKKGDLKPGDNFLRDSAGQVVKAVLDTMSNTLTLEINTPTERSTKTEREIVTEKKDVTQQREDKQEQKQEKQVAVAAEQRRSDKSSSSMNSSQPSATGIIGNWIGLAIAILIVLIGAAWWFFGINKKKTENRKNNSKD